jgi:hypothetical protein
MRRNFLATPFAFSLALPVCAAAQDQSDAEQTRTEFEELRQRMQELENRLDQQSKADTAQRATPAPIAREPAPAPVPERVSSGAVPSGNIDPYGSGFFTAGIPGQRLNAEQACPRNNGSVPGVVAKAERFFSGFGCVSLLPPHAYQSATSCG